MSNPTHPRNGVNRFRSAGDLAANAPDEFDQDGRSDSWDAYPSKAELTRMAREFAEEEAVRDGRADDDELLRLTGTPGGSGLTWLPSGGAVRTVTVPAEALARYEACHHRLFGFLEGLLADLGRAAGPNTMELLSRQLKAKLADVQAQQLEWIGRKCGTTR